MKKLTDKKYTAQFTAKVVITVETDGPFFLKEIREIAGNAIKVDLATEESENELPTSSGAITGVSIDWNTLRNSEIEDEPSRDPNKPVPRMKK